MKGFVALADLLKISVAFLMNLVMVGNGDSDVDRKPKVPIPFLKLNFHFFLSSHFVSTSRSEQGCQINFSRCKLTKIGKSAQ
jgi:hypothetical protein